MVTARADFVVDYLSNGELSVAFPYDSLAVQIVRAMPGRRWRPDAKHWTIPRTALRPLQEQAGRAGIGVAVSERVRQALNMGRDRQKALLAAKTDETPLPLPTSTQPYGFQYAGIRFAQYALHNFRGSLVADDLGLGKTFVALSLIALHPKLQNILVLCLATLKYTWAGEIEKHYPQLSYVVIDGSPRQRSKLWASESRIKIANYEILLRDFEPRLTTWDLVIGDEAVWIKSFKAQRTKRAKKLKRRYTLALSGIPLENNLDELHSVMDFVIPGLLGPGYLFHEQHAVKDAFGHVRGWRGLEEVRQRIAPYYIRRTKAEVLQELPDKVYNDVSLELSSPEWELYTNIVQQIRQKIEENPKLSATNILTEMLRLKQCTSDPRLLNVDIEGTKVAALRDILEVAGDHKIVIFTQFAQLATLLAEEFECPVIQGDVKPIDRAGIVESFQRGEHRCLVSTEAGAYGITLTAADIVIHHDILWNPARMRQREDRLHRIGQKSSVQVVTLVARRTIDEKIRKLLHKKLSLVRAILEEETPEEDARSLSRSDLLELLDD